MDAGVSGDAEDIEGWIREKNDLLLHSSEGIRIFSVTTRKRC